MFSLNQGFRFQEVYFFYAEKLHLKLLIQNLTNNHNLAKRAVYFVFI